MARILIIEDNDANMELMAYLLRAFGHMVQEAVEGKAAVKLARYGPPDLILCDLQMTGMDGYEVMQRMKTNLPNIPVIAVTAYAMVGDRDRVLAAGFDGYIPKPINPETFVGEIEAFLPPIVRLGKNLDS
jgi:CheY-like chemotaxis protein